ncbi:MAG: 1,6-anhydro-N-acetylmuramyl-L-alanine amidase AmpD [Shewanella sp.]|nr:1,6-anhydro-N-acetylmuramyl-L-alanine amidase AmpD [Shewanella sp.]MCF1430806.1 1,6-anhydro-N-acetylmuramyl-L-alanine amidase AmpD [Shewanella sp.]MCF1437395.1 1,6-anhydro-N-acetylmuramyl-L-alanine amidase AmpD [Shewanella sp.]MCF1458585.1 1,6-anhydro-N-acetylmuramyl-L-alanine amidase AmpD [Shewanella sp.]
MAADNKVTGWYPEAKVVRSPHFNARPDAEVSLLVIHNISLPAGQFGTPYVDALFCGTLDCHADESFAKLQGLEVSAHFLIRRDGELVQYVSCDERAWHAGVSSFHGRDNCNDFGIGIELEGTDSLPYTAAQYQQLVRLTDWLMCCYPKITAKRIVGHCDIAPGRKTDPGPCFDWSGYLAAIAGMVPGALSKDE